MIWSVIATLKHQIKFLMKSIPAHCSVDPRTRPEIGELIQKQITTNAEKIESILNGYLEELITNDENGDSVVSDCIDDDQNDIVIEDEANIDDEETEINPNSNKKLTLNNEITTMKRKREESKIGTKTTDQKMNKIAKRLGNEQLKFIKKDASSTVEKVQLLPLFKLSKMFVEAVEKDNEEVDENISNVTRFLDGFRNMLSKQNPEQDQRKKMELKRKRESLLIKIASLERELEIIDQEMESLVDEKKYEDLIAYQEKLKIWETAAGNLKKLNIDKRKQLEKETEDMEKNWLSKLGALN